MASMTRLVFLFVVLVPAVLAVKNPLFEKQEELSMDLVGVPPAPTPAPPLKCKYNTSVDCMADECCNWCGLYFNATIGFCLPLIPVPIPALVCTRVPSVCKTLLTPTDCGGTGDCKWIPMGPPGSLKGMCVYDWDKCKVVPPVSPLQYKPLASRPHSDDAALPAAAATTTTGALAAAAALAAPVPPKPKGVCNITTQPACDAHKCCQWCGTAFNLTAPGFCMPILDFPLPTLTCSKGGAVCASAASEADCDLRGVCTWHPFGPPGAAGPGMCTFDVYKCV